MAQNTPRASNAMARATATAVEEHLDEAGGRAAYTTWNYAFPRGYFGIDSEFRCDGLVLRDYGFVRSWRGRSSHADVGGENAIRGTGRDL